MDIPIKLQAYKSSFQAWKCASFGFALLALVLIGSKWHEVCTDVALLTEIDQLIWSQQQVFVNQTIAQQLQPNASLALSMDSILALSNWTANGPLGQEDGVGLNSSLVAQHLQVMLGRELNGNELLRREVEAFLGESLF